MEECRSVCALVCSFRRGILECKACHGTLSLEAYNVDPAALSRSTMAQARRLKFGVLVSGHKGAGQVPILRLHNPGDLYSTVVPLMSVCSTASP